MSAAERFGRVLIVDPDESFLRPLRPYLIQHFAAVHSDANVTVLPDLLTREKYDVILIHSGFLQPSSNGESGMFWIERIHELDPLVTILVRCRAQESELALQAIREGATDYLVDPWHKEKLLATLVASVRLRKSREETLRLREQHHHAALLSQSLNLDEIEQQAINLALQKHKGNISHTARELGLTRTSLYRRIQKYGIQPGR